MIWSLLQELPHQGIKKWTKYKRKNKNIQANIPSLIISPHIFPMQSRIPARRLSPALEQLTTDFAL